MALSTFLTLCLLCSRTCIASNDSSAETICPTWMYRINATSSCECGNSLNNAVLCDQVTQEVKVRTCYMLTFDVSSKEVLAGYSFYSCVRPVDVNYQLYIPFPSNTSQINFELCDTRKRGGLFCGECKENYWPLVFSYKPNCTMCSERETRKNWFFFMALAFIPVSLFYGFVLLFKFNANSASLHGYIFFAQILTQTLVTKTLLEDLRNQNLLMNITVRVIWALYSVWNLNFFSAFSPDICLHVSTLGALSLEYVVAFYPMILMMVTYLIIELHSRGFKIVVMIWRPFQRCSLYFRKTWNIKTSLIDVFATFLLLSYSRLLDISFSFLMPITAYNSRGYAVGRYLYYDSSKEFFGEEHRPFGIFAICVLLTFNCMPLLLLLFYPMNWFQRCLNCTKLNHIALHTFIDRFTGCYKDGTEPGTRDCRYFAALFLLLRFTNFVVITCTYDNYYTVVFTIILVCYSVIFISAQPYRSKFSQHNTTVMVFLVLSICLCCCLYGVRYTKFIRPQSFASLVVFTFIVGTLPHVYGAYLVIKFACHGVL